MIAHEKGHRMLTHRQRPVTPVLCAAAVLFLSCCGAAFAATSSHASLAGTWSGRYGGAFAGTFTLHWTQTGSKLHGSIVLSYPHGTYSVTGRVRGRAITFGAVGAGATYSGSVSGTSMSGHYTTPRGGGAWSAHKRR